MKNKHVEIQMAGGEKVSGIVSIPGSGVFDTAVIIAHGAGNDMNYPMLVFLAEGLADSGYICLRFNFLYREEGKRSPDSANVLYHAWQGALGALVENCGYRPKRIFAAGKSLGGRIASQMVAEKCLQVEGLIFLGYPLHAPGKTDRLRDGHLYKIQVPMLFFAGTKDPLCNLGALRQALAKVSAPWELEVVEGGDHSFQVPSSFAMGPDKVYGAILGKTIEWLSSRFVVKS